MDQSFYTTPEHLMRVLGTVQAPALIDVCIPEDVAADPFRLPGARRMSHRDIDGAPTGDVVVVCQKGLKLSLGVAAHLRARGQRAVALDGGVLAWGAAKLPRIREDGAAAAYVLSPPCDTATLLTVWVVRRWLAPDARILWAPVDMATAVADRFDATATGNGPADLLTTAGLTWPPLHSFVDCALSRPDGWSALLTGLRRLHSTHEATADAALPVIDAAWTALRKDIP
ncbi:MAG: hypothetical protein AAFQ59_06485 [Pseudomonadota bacterium]